MYRGRVDCPAIGGNLALWIRNLKEVTRGKMLPCLRNPCRQSPDCHWPWTKECALTYHKVDRTVP